MTLSIEQEKALKEVDQWLKKSDQQVFRLFGFAGTGKTTLAKYFAENLDKKTLFATFTGKAALVLRKKGCFGASTIHNLIYKLEEDINGKLSFSLSDESKLSGAGLLVVDECSMVNAEIGEDLLSFGVKILVLGDPFQLPPVSGAGFFTECEPDFLLREIHRQAKDNPIIKLASDVRTGKGLNYGVYGSSKVVKRLDPECSPKSLLEYDQVIVGKNVTRSSFNNWFRKQLRFEGELPLENDKVICLRNNHSMGLLNGSLWKVTASRLDPSDCRFSMLNLISDDEKVKQTDVRTHNSIFQGDDLDYKNRKDGNEFDYGYAITCHKAQGSQWDSVFIVDESQVFRQNADRWLYTAITRAAESVVIRKS